MGEVPATSDSIVRLKELLFDVESQTLDDLARRIETLTGETSSAHSGLASSIKALGDSEGRSRADLSARIDEIAARVGRDIDLEASVAAVLDGAFRRADVAKHADVADAVAPFVVNTVRTEIRNSKDELVEALYPVTGRIVRAYVASAMKDIVDQINRRLESNPVMLRLRSLATGRSVAELALADSQRLNIEELYLIRRGTGELVERWPDADSGNRDQVMSGVLTAINEFAAEAFDTDGNALRQIDLGGDRVYLRESVAYLLAAKCSGTAPVAIEQILDAAFLDAIAKLGSAARDHRPPVLSALARELDASIEAKQAGFGRGRSFSPLKLIALVVGLPLVALIAWSVYSGWRVAETERIARDVLQQSAEFKGYPSTIRVGRLGESLTLTGLAPTEGAKRVISERLTISLPGVAITNDLSVVPNPLADVEPELDRLRGKAEELGRTIVTEAERRDHERALRRLARAKTTLAALVPDLTGDQKHRATDAVAAVNRALTELAKADRADVTTLQAIAEQTRNVARNLSTLLAARPPDATEQPDPAATATASVLAAAEEIDMVSVALAQTVALKAALPGPNPREKLEAWTRAHAVFFSEEDLYREPEEAAKSLAQLAALLSDNDAVLRIIGYTDGLGGAERNSPLSLARANRVAADLAAAGVPLSRLIVLGRPNLRDISTDDGVGSPNRRVEFELGFEGEARR